MKYPLFGLFLSFLILSFFWIYIFRTFNLKAYKNIQRVHQDEVSRLGGFIIYLFLWMMYYLNGNFFLLSLLISAIPIILISLKEDLFQNTLPKNRLLLMIMSCSIFFYVNPINLPIIDIPYFGYLISLFPFNYFFFIFALLVLINGMNFIDGVNGLFGFTALFQLISLGLLSFAFNDFDSINLIVIFSLPLIIFLLFNFPFGKIFIGDLGAYFYGFIIGFLTIYIFGKYYGDQSWIAVLILIYPCFETLFSILRKMISKTNPSYPDQKHIHTKLFKLLIRGGGLIETSLKIILILFPFIGFSLISLLVKDSYFLIMFFLILFILIYLVIYIVILKLEKS